MATELIINASLPETRISLMEDGEIQEVLIERASGKGIVGNIYKGRVTRVLPGMQAAFVDIGLEKAAFLYVDDVYNHSEVLDDTDPVESDAPAEGLSAHDRAASEINEEAAHVAANPPMSSDQDPAATEISEPDEDEMRQFEAEGAEHLESDFEGDDEGEESDESDGEHEAHAHDLDSDEEDEDSGEGDPVGMGREPGDGDEDSTGNREHPPGTVSESDGHGHSGQEAVSAENADHGSDDAGEDFEDDSEEGSEGSSENAEGGAPQEVAAEGNGDHGPGGDGGRKRRRGRRGGRNRRRREGGAEGGAEGGLPRGEVIVRPVIAASSSGEAMIYEDSASGDDRQSDRAALAPDAVPTASEGVAAVALRPAAAAEGRRRPEFREPRSRDRKIRSKSSMRPQRGQVSIQDLLQEGQEVLVQVAKDPISTKGARLTCHISLPGRHLVCMPTIDHVGVSRRIDRDDERRRLRDFVERNRSKKLGFIVRTASGKGQKSEARIKQDIDYLTRLWDEIREKSSQVTAPALVYEDLNSVLRAIRDWVSEEIDKIIVDSRYHYNEILRFCSHFMPSLKQKVELYHGDAPIFDAYMISPELARALERKVWLKSGGYIVIDQAEALVAIDVNTGRYVGKKSLEDTILKTNLEAVVEIAYQLRLRNCGGIIILDLIDMEKEENKQRVYRALEEALKKDRARPSILKISELGLVEMTRKRTRDTMVRALCETCPHCDGKGYIKSKQTVAYELLREIEREGILRDVAKILIQAHPDVIDTMAIEERETLDSLERRYKKQIYLQAVADFHIEQHSIISEKRDGSPKGADAAQTAFDERDRQRGGTPDRERDRQEARDRSKDRGGRESGREGARDGGRDRGRGRDRNASKDGGRGRNGGRDGGRGGQDRGQGGLPQPLSARDAQFQNADMPAPVSVEGSAEGAPESQMPRVKKELVLPLPNSVRPILNRPPAPPAFDEDSIGNMAHSGNEIPSDDALPAYNGPEDDAMTEEDRIAYMRAQAAQDAALMGRPPATGNRMGAPGAGRGRMGGGPGRGPGGAGGAGGPGGGSRRRRGRRGGRGGPGRGPNPPGGGGGGPGRNGNSFPQY